MEYEIIMGKLRFVKGKNWVKVTRPFFKFSFSWKTVQKENFPWDYKTEEEAFPWP